MLERIRFHAEQLWRRPVAELGLWGRGLRYGARLARQCARRLEADRATEMAAALTYRTLFGLVPAVVLSLLLFRSFVGLEGVASMLEEQVKQFLNLSDVKVAMGAEADERREMQAIIDERIAQFTERAYELDFRSVGGVGLALLIWAALALLITVENCFNTVCRAAAGRPWRYRVPVYWTVLTLGPLLLTISLYAADRFVAWASDLMWVGPVVEQLTRLSALVASWLLLLLLYQLVPNARVQTRAAVGGALVAAILWEGAKLAFESYVNHAVPYSALYGSLGLIPLFLLWIYVTWLVVLLGLELTDALQTVSVREDAEAAAPEAHARWLLPALAAAGAAFESGRAVSVPRLARELRIPTGEAAAAAARLAADGWLRPVANGEEPAYVLALPADRIPVAEVLAGDSPPDGVPGSAFLQRLEAARRRAAGDATLADVL